MFFKIPIPSTFVPLLIIKEKIMKNLIKRSLVIVVMFATMVGNANEVTNLTKEKIKKVTNVTFENVKQGSTLIIKDDNGLILFKELIEKSGEYTKGFDLTALPDGSYYFELDKETQIKIMPFEVTNNDVVFHKNEEYIINKPVVFSKNKYIFISKLSLKQEPLTIEIYFENDNFVFSEVIKDKLNLERIYDFSTSEKGSYKIILRSEGRSFIENIQI